MCAKVIRGERIPYNGNYGEMYTEVPPIPDNAPVILDWCGRKWFYYGDIDEYTVRVGRIFDDGHVSAYPYNREFFPCLDNPK